MKPCSVFLRQDVVNRYDKQKSQTFQYWPTPNSSLVYMLSDKAGMLRWHFWPVPTSQRLIEYRHTLHEHLRHSPGQRDAQHSPGQDITCIVFVCPPGGGILPTTNTPNSVTSWSTTSPYTLNCSGPIDSHHHEVSAWDSIPSRRTAAHKPGTGMGGFGGHSMQHAPFWSFFQVSPIMIRPKKGSIKRYVTLDLSWTLWPFVECGHIAFYIILACLTSRHTLVALMLKHGPDLIVPLFCRTGASLRSATLWPPTDWPYLVSRIMGNTTLKCQFLWHPLGVGGMACQQATSGLCHIVDTHSHDCPNYIDHLAGCEPLLDTANQAFTWLCNIMQEPWLQESQHIAILPTNTMTWIGAGFDTIRMELHMPQFQIEESLQLCRNCKHWSRTTRTQIQQFLGKALSHRPVLQTRQAIDSFLACCRFWEPPLCRVPQPSLLTWRVPGLLSVMGGMLQWAPSHATPSRWHHGRSGQLPGWLWGHRSQRILARHIPSIRPGTAAQHLQPGNAEHCGRRQIMGCHVVRTPGATVLWQCRRCGSTTVRLRPRPLPPDMRTPNGY